MNKVILIGRLGANPEIRKTDNTTIATISVATDESYKDKEGNKVDVTEWHRVVVFGKLAEIVGEYFEKGRLVLVEGKLRTRSWEDGEGYKRYTTEIIAKNLRLLDSKKQSESESKSEPETSIEDDDIPF